MSRIDNRRLLFNTRSCAFHYIISRIYGARAGIINRYTLDKAAPGINSTLQRDTGAAALLLAKRVASSREKLVRGTKFHAPRARVRTGQFREEGKE